MLPQPGDSQDSGVSKPEAAAAAAATAAAIPATPAVAGPWTGWRWERNCMLALVFVGGQ
jgi:hypothetical protein